MNFTFFSSAHGIFSRIDHILGHKYSLGKFKKVEIISSIFSDQNVVRLDVNYRKLSAKERFWAVVLEETLESPLDCKKIQPVYLKGNQSWIFIGRTDAKAETPIPWSPDAKHCLIGKDPDAGNDWRREEKGTTEEEVVGWHHQLDGHEF